MKNTGNSRKLYALLLTAALILSTVACGSKDGSAAAKSSASGGKGGVSASAGASAGTESDTAEGELGKYTCRQVLSQGLDAGANGEYVELKTGNKAVIQITDTPYDATYKQDGENITVSVMGDDNTGTLKDGVLTLSIMSMDYVFVKDGQDYTPDPSTIIGYSGDAASEEAATDEAASEDSSGSGKKGPASGKGAISAGKDSADAGEAYTPEEIWHGRWIGCMYMDDTAGSYTDYEGKYVTAVANMDAEDGKDYFDVYLPNNGYSEDDNSAFLSIYVDLFEDHFMIDDDEGWVTNMTITSEYYPDYYVIFLPDHGNLITFSSTYVDPDDPKGHFRFTLELRPNGSMFDDSYDNFPSELPDAYKSYCDYLEGDKCTKNVIDGLTGTIVIDRGSPVYCPGVSKADAGGSSGGSSGDDTSASASASGASGGVLFDSSKAKTSGTSIDGEDGFASMTVPSGWETETWGNMSATKGDESITIMMSYLNGYDLYGLTHAAAVDPDGNRLDIGKAEISGREFYAIGPYADSGSVYCHLFGEWKKDPERCVEMYIRVGDTEDLSKMNDMLKDPEVLGILKSIKLHD